MKNNVIIGGLIVGALLGFAGRFLPEGMPLEVAWAVSGLGLMAAYVLLAARHARAGQDEIAAGFVLMAIGEGALFSALASGVEGSQTAFAGGASIFLLALSFIGVPSGFALWTRAAGVLAGVLFGAAALQIYAGQEVLATTSPVVGGAYGMLTVAIVGWIIALLRGKRTAAA